MMLRADQRDYKNAFKKHLSACYNWNTAGSNYSKRLILTYCVECGLKSEIMRQEKIQNVKEAQDDIKNDLETHDLRKLLKRLNQASSFTFPSLKTYHNDSVDPGTYHQLCRYCIRTEDKYNNAIKQYDETLEEIVKWLEERA